MHSLPTITCLGSAQRGFLIVTSAEHIRTAMMFTIAFSAAFAQGYHKYRKYRSQPNTSRGTVISYQTMLVLTAALAVVAVGTNVLAAFGFMQNFTSPR